MIRMPVCQQNKIQRSDPLPEQQAADIRFAVAAIDQTADFSGTDQCGKSLPNIEKQDFRPIRAYPAGGEEDGASQDYRQHMFLDKCRISFVQYDP